MFPCNYNMFIAILILLIVYTSAEQCPALCSPVSDPMYCGGFQPCSDFRICCSVGTHCAILSEEEKYVCVKTEINSKDKIIFGAVFGGVFGGAVLCCCLWSCYHKCCRNDENVIPEGV
jgi:hypothetical protein